MDEVGAAEPVKGERIQGQIRLTRFNRGVWAEARLITESVRVCDRCLQAFPQQVRTEFAELCRIGGPIPASVENDELFVDSDGVLDLWEVFRQHLILNLPSKLLCNPQCAGICLHCGVYADNHNHKCRARDRDLQLDPRWGELAALGASGERGR